MNIVSPPNRQGGNMKYRIVMFLTLLFISCSDERITNPSNNPLENAAAGVRVKKVYPSLESTQILSVEDFDYDRMNRLQKKSYYGGDREILYCYDEYNYDDNGLLLRRFNYHSNVSAPSGFLLLKATTYSYSNGLLLSERTVFPEANYYEESRYGYKDGQRILKSFYHNNSLESKTIYKYVDSKLMNESIYNEMERIVYSIDYIYLGNRLSETRHYTSSGDLSQRISYSYNTNGKLITENIEMIPIYSSTLSSVVRYEY
jgi:hypothetical protein